MQSAGHASSFAKVFCKKRQLSTRCWLPEGESPHAVLFIAHGYGEHSGSYERLAQEFVENRVAVYSHDHVGHGRSPGRRALVKDMAELVEPIVSHLTQLSERHANLPLFLLGHSMGGLASALVAMTKPEILRGLLLVAPALAVDPATTSGALVTLNNAIARVRPSTVMPGSGTRPELLTSDNAIRNEVQTDPLHFRKGLRAGTGSAIVAGMKKVKDYRVNLPLLVLHSRNDLVTYFEGSRDFFDRAESTDKEFLAYDRLGHQLHKEAEPHGSQIRRAMVEWLLKRSSVG